MDELPVVKGLLVCERVEQDRRTGNVSVVNRFRRLRSPAYPSPPRLVSVFAALSDGYGRFTFQVVVTNLSTEAQARTERREMLLADRLAEVQVVFHLPAFSFPVPGWYEFTLYADAEPLVSQRVEAVGPTGGSDET
jgi:hypothetical protein